MAPSLITRLQCPWSWGGGWLRHPSPALAPCLVAGRRDGVAAGTLLPASHPAGAEPLAWSRSRPPAVAEAVTWGSVPRGVAGKGNLLWPQHSGQAALLCWWPPWGRCLQSGAATRSPRGDRSGLPGVGWWHRSCLCPTGGSGAAVGTGEHPRGVSQLESGSRRVGCPGRRSRLHRAGRMEGTGHRRDRGTDASAPRRGLPRHRHAAAPHKAPLCQRPGRPPGSAGSGQTWTPASRSPKRADPVLPA